MNDPNAIPMGENHNSLAYVLEEKPFVAKHVRKLFYRRVESPARKTILEYTSFFVVTERFSQSFLIWVSAPGVEFYGPCSYRSSACGCKSRVEGFIEQMCFQGHGVWKILDDLSVMVGKVIQHFWNPDQDRGRLITLFFTTEGWYRVGKHVMLIVLSM